MNNDAKQKDNEFLGELDIDHIDQAEIIKPTIISPTNVKTQAQTENNLTTPLLQGVNYSNQPIKPNENSITTQPINIQDESATAANNIIYNEPPSAGNSLNIQQNQSPPATASNGIYSTDPSNVPTDLSRNPILQSNIVTPEQNQSLNSQPYINIPIYGGVIDSSQAKDNITVKPPVKKKPFYKNKKLMLITLGAIFFISIILGIIFGLYLPNTPNNVWKTGLSRTGKQSSAVIQALSDPKISESLKKSKIEAGGTVTYNEQNYSVNSNASIDASKSDTTAQVKASSGSEENFVVDVALKTDLPETALLPNIYLKVDLSDPSLFKSFGIPEKYNNVWISAEQDFMSELAKTYNLKLDDSKNITKEDIISVVNDFNTVSQQYIFTSDPQFAVVVKKSFIGSEEINNSKANHYKAGVNKDNAKQYCYAVFEKLINNESYKKYALSGDTNTEARKQENKQECDKLVNDIPNNLEFDIWINKSIKIVQQVRFYEDLSKQVEEAQKRKTECLQTYDAYSKDSCDYVDDFIEKGQKYIEFGQIIKSKKELLLYTSDVSDTDKNKSSFRAEIYVNSETYELNGKINAKADNPNNKLNADLAFKMLPYQGETDTSKPKDAVPIQQVIEESEL